MHQSQGQNINPAAGKIKRIRLPAKCEVTAEFEELASDALAYLDGVELLFPAPFRVTRLRQLHGNRVAWWEACRDREGRAWGWRLIVPRPNKQVLRDLDRLQRKYKGKLFRVDIALDLMTSNEADAIALKHWLLKRTLLRWRRKAFMRDEEDTTYWIDHVRRRRRSTRNVALYADRPSKVTGQCDCVHLELRFLTARACRREGFSSTRSLINLDPAQILEKHLKFTNFDIRGFQQDRIRKAVKDDQRQHRHTNREISPFLDQYRASIPKRVQGHLTRTQQDRVQRIKDLHPHLIMHAIDVGNLNLPTQLEWGIEITPENLTDR